MGTVLTYREEFQPGTRVVVRAGAGEGSDHEFNGRTGTMVDYHGHLAVEIDRLPRYWENPVLICMHNLRRTDGQQAAKEE